MFAAPVCDGIPGQFRRRTREMCIAMAILRHARTYSGFPWPLDETTGFEIVSGVTSPQSAAPRSAVTQSAGLGCWARTVSAPLGLLSGSRLPTRPKQSNTTPVGTLRRECRRDVRNLPGVQSPQTQASTTPQALASTEGFIPSIWFGFTKMPL